MQRQGGSKITKKRQVGEIQEEKIVEDYEGWGITFLGGKETA